MHRRNLKILYNLINAVFQEEYLWGMLAAMAANAKNFYAAEIAYGALDEVCLKILIIIAKQFQKFF